MYNIQHDIYYLDHISKQYSLFQAEFACQTKSKDIQKRASHFVIELQNSISQNEVQQQGQKGNKLNPNSNFIAGIFYCNYDSFSEQLKQTALHSLLQSIYFQNKDYLEAFKNCLNMLQNCFDYSEISNSLLICKSKMQKGVIYINQQPLVTANLILKLNDDIYISKSLNNFDKIENMYYLQRNGVQQVIKIDPLKDLLDYSKELFKIKDGVIQSLDFIILTDSLTIPFQKLFNKNLKQIYPIDPKKVRSGNFMHFLKVELF